MSRMSSSHPKDNVKSDKMCVDCKNLRGTRLLRLNSTGEISSAKAGHSIHSRLKDRQPPRSQIQHFDKSKSVMCSIGAYIGSAANCLGNLYSRTTAAKGFVRDSFPYTASDSILEELVSETSKTNGDTMKPDCRNHLPKYPDKMKHWTQNIMNALHTSLMNNCSSNMSTMDKNNAEKYVPPQRRQFRNCENGHKPVAVDPILTPYNARLLQKSKLYQSNVRKCHPVSFPFQTPIVCETASTYAALEPKIEKKNVSSVANKTSESLDVDCSEYPGISKCEEKTIYTSTVDEPVYQTEDEADNNEAEVTDWFDYECKRSESESVVTDTCMPDNLRYDENISSSQEKETSDSQLKSWFSIENETESSVDSMVNSDSSSQLHAKPQSICDTEGDVEGSKLPDDSRRVEVLDSAENSLCTHTESDICDKNQPSSAEQKVSDSKDVCDSSVKETSLIAALYIRHCGKRSRPSAKKRRRHKAQQQLESEPSKNCVDKKAECKNKLNSDIPSQPRSLVAFILGNDSDDEADNGSHTFSLHCDFDSDSDWSENDSDNLSSMDDEDLIDSDIGFRCTNPLMFRMSCSVQSTTPVTQPEEDPSSIEKINMQWKVQVSVETEAPKKKLDSSKQVHFAEAKSLTTVHPMVTWCYAYQAARKGPWEQYARDHARFMRRVAESADILNPVLQQNHRDTIFHERFSAAS